MGHTIDLARVESWLRPKEKFLLKSALDPLIHFGWGFGGREQVVEECFCTSVILM